MFEPWPQNKYLRHLEGQAHGLRKRAILTPLQLLEPRDVARTLPNVMLAELPALAALSPDSNLAILERESETWSALALRIDGGPWLVTWNPWHAPTRTRVSVMEEIAHIVLEHKPTSLTPHPTTGLPVRAYSPSKEKEAYGVAAAAVLPYVGLVQLLRQGKSDAEIAAHYGVSVQLVTMRINLTKARLAAGVATLLAKSPPSASQRGGARGKGA
jgi:hypothetical protein